MRAGTGTRAFAAQLRAVQRFVLHGDAAGAALVAGNRRASRTQRLRIYRDAYYLRLHEALGDTFPRLARRLGPRPFAVLVRRFADGHPSRHRSIRWYGGALGAWLRRTEPYAARRELAELARWEWALAAAFDAADRPALDRGAAQQWAPADWPAMRFTFHPSLRLLSLSTDAAPHLPRRDPQPAARQRHWAIWRRRDLEVVFDALTKVEAGLLRAAWRGAPLAELCERVPDSEDAGAAAAWMAQRVAGWIDRGWIVAADPA